MADDIDDIEDEEDGEEKPKKSLLKLGLFIGLPVLILLLAGIGGFMMFAGGGDDAEAEHAEAAEGEGDGHGAGAAADHSAAIYYYDLREGDGTEETITTNIRSSDGRAVIVQLKITFESSNPNLGPVLEEHVDPIMDQFIMFLRELREDDLYGSAGMHRVRLELLRRVNLAIEPAQVDAVWIQEFMIVD
ncbi:flagellar basal body-associated FliL family protein [Maricaulis sp. CAU 1757]